MLEKSPVRVEVSYKTVVFTTAFLIGLWLIIQLKEIIIFLFLSAIVLSALLKPVEWLTAKRVPRALATLLVYIIVIGLLSATIAIIVPPLVAPTSDFARVLTQQVQSFAGNVIDISKAILSSIILLLILLVLTFYLILEWKNIVRIISSPFSGRQEKKVVSIISKVEKGLGSWIRGQLALSVVVGVFTYIGLIILKVPYALPLALISGMFEIIPIIGPLIAAIPGVLVGLSISPVLGLATIAMYVVVQQLENHLIVPMVMSKVVGLQPPAVILALLIGAKLSGVGGAFFAIPIIVVVKILIKELLMEDQKLEDGLIEE